MPELRPSENQPIAEPARDDVDPMRRSLLVGAGIAAGIVAVGGTYLAVAYEENWWPLSGGNEGEAPQWKPSHENSHDTNTAPTIKTPAEFAKAPQHTMLTGDWQMLGATQNPGSTMLIEASGWAVRKVDDSGFIPKPPQLLNGPRIKTGGNEFGIAGRLSNVKTNQAAVFFHGEPDVVLDEEVHRMPAIGIRVAKNKIIVEVYDGKKNEPATSHELADAPGNGTADFWLQQTKDGIRVGSGAKAVNVRADIFGKQVIFGADGNFTLDSLTAYSTGEKPVTIEDTSKRTLPPINPNGFQGIANAKGRKDLKIATAVDFTSIDDSMELMSNVGAVESEMLAKLQAVYKGTPDASGNIRKEDFDFTEVRAFIDMAKRSGRDAILHALVWNEAMPKPVETFLKKCIKSGDTKAALNFVEQHVAIMVDEFKDDVKTIDVVNEPMGSTDNDSTAVQPQQGLVFKATGGSIAQFEKDGHVEWVELAVKTAKEHGAKRVRINENGLETWAERRNGFKRLVKPLAEKGYVDAVGLQCHFDDSDIKNWVNDDAGGRVDATYVSDDLNTVVNEIASELGVEVDFSEFSVDTEGNDVQSQEQAQAAVYAGGANAAMRSHHVKIFGMWGLYNNKRYMTTTYNSNGSIELGNDAPWKPVHGKPAAKPAVAAIKAGLRGEIQPLA